MVALPSQTRPGISAIVSKPISQVTPRVSRPGIYASFYPGLEGQSTPPRRSSLELCGTGIQLEGCIKLLVDSSIPRDKHPMRSIPSIPHRFNAPESLARWVGCCTVCVDE